MRLSAGSYRRAGSNPVWGATLVVVGGAEGKFTASLAGIGANRAFFGGFGVL